VPVGDGEIEPIQSLNPSLPQSQFLRTHGQGIHHISLNTKNIESEVNRMRKKGVAFAAEQPNMGDHGVNITFTKPETTDNTTIRPREES
jgi:methylmalonyl-CoA/ethylmalonyl-CoA epimerase